MQKLGDPRRDKAKMRGKVHECKEKALLTVHMGKLRLTLGKQELWGVHEYGGFILFFGHYINKYFSNFRIKLRACVFSDNLNSYR